MAIDSNRSCWNCKHFGTYGREFLDGECRLSPPIYDGFSTFFQYIADSNDAWCGNWERNNINYGAAPIRNPLFFASTGNVVDRSKIRPGRPKFEPRTMEAKKIK